METVPVISIITPSFNQGEYLAATIESVIGQAGDFFLDYIIVDGGSTDDSVAVIRRYHELLASGDRPMACRGIRFRWVSERDEGQTDALVKGFGMATGEVLAWLNSDDTYLPGALQAAARFFRDNPDAGLMYGDARYTDAAGAVIGSYRTAEFDLDRLAAANMVCQPAAFFTRQAFDAAGGLEPALRFAMDYDLWIRIGRIFPCRHLPEALATYRLHETSKTIAGRTLEENAEEGLQVTMRHFGWAPLTRVYTSCLIRCAARLPAFLARSKSAVTTCAVVTALFRSIRLNRGINLKDLRLIRPENFRKLGRSRLDLMTGCRKRTD